MIIFVQHMTVSEFMKIQLLCSQTYLVNNRSQKKQKSTLFTYRNFQSIIKYIRRIGNLTSWQSGCHKVRLQFWEAKLFNKCNYEVVEQKMGAETYQSLVKDIKTFKLGKKGQLQPQPKLNKQENQVFQSIHIDLLHMFQPLRADLTEKIPLYHECLWSCQRILYALCIRILPAIGFSMPLNQLVSSFLIICDYDEEKTFKLTLSFILNKQLMSLYLPQMYEYQLKNFVLEKLMEQHLGKVHENIFQKLLVNLDSVTYQWINTLLLGFIIDRRVVLPLLDNFILENPFSDRHNSWRVVLSYIIALLHQNHKKLTRAKSPDDIRVIFQTMMDNQEFGFKCPYDFHVCALHFQRLIKLDKLQEYELAYFKQHISSQLTAKKQNRFQKFLKSEVKDTLFQLNPSSLEELREEENEIYLRKKKEMTHFEEKVFKLDHKSTQLYSRHKKLISLFEMQQAMVTNQQADIKKMEQAKVMMRKLKFSIQLLQRMQQVSLMMLETHLMLNKQRERREQFIHKYHSLNKPTDMITKGFFDNDLTDEQRLQKQAAIKKSMHLLDKEIIKE